MTTRAAAQGATPDAALRNLDVAIATKHVKVLLDSERELGADLVAEVAGITTRIIEEIVGLREVVWVKSGSISCGEAC